MAVLERTELEQSPLADLHAIASELGIEGFRRLRREELIGLLAGDAGGETTESPATESPAPARRARRSTRSATSRRSA
ncbi:MAG: Rho termination factor N-terminal domain-containing protein, partial [Thermoleophilaceae bacterium]|nr:Rho termination factor N-terminal domain-containing protein [Thermoleophilaceae bacterium]